MRQRIDQISSGMNAWLLVIAIGLGMLDLTVLVAKALPPLPQMTMTTDTADESAPDHPAPPAPAR